MTRLYEHYWRPMEVNFGQETYATQFDSFMRHYLTVKTGKSRTVRAVYEAFKQNARSGQVKSTEQCLRDIRMYAGYYCAMALASEEDSNSRSCSTTSGNFGSTSPTHRPELDHDYAIGVLAKADLLRAARLVESYVFRRSVCGIRPTP